MSDQEHIIRLLGENAAKAAKEYTDEITALRKGNYILDSLREIG